MNSPHHIGIGAFRYRGLLSWLGVATGVLPFCLVIILTAFVPQSKLLAQTIYETPYTFTTLAGSGENSSAGSHDGLGSAARFNFPMGVAVDSSGTVYVADMANNCIRKITPEGMVTTLANLPALPDLYRSSPTGIAVDTAGNVYVAESSNNRILKITPYGMVTTLAGNSTPNPDLPRIPTFFGTIPDPSNRGRADGPASNARFDEPTGVAVDSAGNLCVADRGNRTIRKISPNGLVTTLAGRAGFPTGSVDGTGSEAWFWSLNSLAADNAGNLYVCDGPRIRKITAAGVVTSIPPLTSGMDIPGSTDGPSDVARFSGPAGVTVDRAGNVYVADTNNQTIRKISVTGIVTTLAGSAGNRGATDGTGSLARFGQPWGMAVDEAGNLYVADTSNHAIRKGNLAPSKAAQTITFAELANHSFGETPLVLSATASSGLPVNFIVFSGPASLSGSTLTLTGTGTITIRASQSGNENFEAAPEVERSFIVNPAAIAPIIITQPIAQTVGVGSSVTLTITASGTPVPIYQWQKNGVDISGATGASLFLANVQSSDAGNYTCIATNSASSVTSNAATLVIGTIPAGFDVQGYLSRYPDVAARYGSDTYGAWLFYRDHGLYQGEVFDELFRVEEYLALYPELFALFGSDLRGALEHWLSTGRIEGKLGRIPLEFSAPGYFARNPDVAVAVGHDPILAWGHFWLYGIYEGRAYDDELNVFEYLAINADLTAAFVDDWRNAALHWMRYGRTEGRLGRIPLIFISTEYLNRNPDVAPTWGTNPTTDFLHFWLYGISEGRTFDDEFRSDEYLALNPDLAALFGADRREAFKHWVRYGRAEGRLGRNH